MLVETFEVVESTEKEIECLAETVALAEKLGLKGQAEVSANNESPNPYRPMTQEEESIYGAILTEKTSIENFKEHLIPLRVLQIYEHAKSLGIFKDFMVWYSKSAQVKDPVLTCVKGNTFFLLARWGEVLQPMNELREFAGKILKTKLKMAYLTAADEVAGYLKRLEEISGQDLILARDKFRGWINVAL